jgi:hypothetical protein
VEAGRKKTIKRHSVSYFIGVQGSVAENVAGYRESSIEISNIRLTKWCVVDTALHNGYSTTVVQGGTRV